MNKLKLRIGPVIQNADDVKARVKRELSQHVGLISLASGVGTAARDAERIAHRLRRPFGLHRLPAAFLAVALVLLGIWIYVQFFRVTTLKIALPDRDAHKLRSRIEQGSRLQFVEVPSTGSPDSIKMVLEGTADLGFVQGGVEIPAKLPRIETPNPEIVLWFVRSTVPDLGAVRRILTSIEGAGSHSVAKAFVAAWQIESNVEFVHDWNRLAKEADYRLPDDIDAAFVVKDPSDAQT